MPSSPPSPCPSYDFDIDRFLNPFLPRPRLDVLPRPLSRLLGYRPPDHVAVPIGSIPIAIYSFLGAFISLSLISLITHVLPIPLPDSDPFSKPIIIASFGASAILEYNSISSPLSQPRNLILGQLLSCLIGIAITKAFERLSPSAADVGAAGAGIDSGADAAAAAFENLRWLAGALAVATASVVMTLTKTVHPPAGATALLVATTPQVTELGWWLLLVMGIGSIVMLLMACLLNNIQRVWPLWWWTEHDLSSRRRPPRPSKQGSDSGEDGGPGDDVEKEAGNAQARRRDDSSAVVGVVISFRDGGGKEVMLDGESLTSAERAVVDALIARVR